VATMTLTFDLTDEFDDAQKALNASNYELVLINILRELRSCYKYNVSFVSNEPATGDEMEVAETIKNRIYQLALSNSITLDLVPD